MTRGLLLVVLELTVLHVAWTFTFDFTHLLAGVIWMLGWCMVLMARARAAPAAGGWRHRPGGDLRAESASTPLAAVMPQSTQWLWQFLYLGGEVKIGRDVDSRSCT